MNPFARSTAPSIHPTSWLLGVAALVASSSAAALTIQSLKAHSATGQALRAELLLNDVQVTDLPQLRVSIGREQAYRDAKLNRPAVLDQARIQFSGGSNHQAHYLITTEAPVHEDALTLLIEVNSPLGRLHHTFTLKLDTKSSPRESSQTPVTVVRGDTLSELMIAHRYGVGTMAQRLIATQRANPKAFIRDNVHLVRAGAQLRLPSREAILAIDPQEAQRLIHAQLLDFEAYRRGLAQQARAVSTRQDERKGTVEQALKGETKAPSGDRLSLSGASTTTPNTRADAIGNASNQPAVPASKNGAVPDMADGSGVKPSAGQTDAQLADQKNLEQAHSRQQELTTNIQALKDVATMAGSANSNSNDNSAAPAIPAASAPTSSAAEPAWITTMKRQAWLLPAVGIALVLLALWVWLRRSSAPKPTEAAALHQAEQVVQPAADPVEPEAEHSPAEASTPMAEPPSLSALLPDVDLELPDLGDDLAKIPPVSEASMLEQAKAKMRNGDLEGARALAEEALTSADPMIQDNAKAFLERL